MFISIMSDCVHPTLANIPKFEPTPFHLSSNPSIFSSRMLIGFKDYSITNLGRIFRSKDKTLINQRQKIGSIHCVFSSNGFDFGSELNFEGENELGLEFTKKSSTSADLRAQKSLKREGCKNSEFGELGFVEPLEEKEKKAKNRVPKGEGLMGMERGVGSDDELEELMETKEKRRGKLGSKSRRKELIKRSSLLAKQVIGIQSALSLGFVSQLWVDTASWLVRELEVRPSLLSSESGTVRLEDVKQVGDVVLVQDETFLFNELRTVGLETLVGYSVVTPGQRNLGKVRGFTFNINSGSVEALELDAFGVPIIPSSLVSTYALLTGDVLDVVSDTIIVHEAAASQRLTKGFLGSKSREASGLNLEYRDEDEEPIRPVKSRKSRRKLDRRKPRPGSRDFDDDLELPMDYM